MSTETEFFLALSLSEENRKKYQFVYSSDLYGSFFCVYATFDFTVNGEKGTFKEAKFKIYNYKGHINIGIKEVEYDEKDQKFVIRVQGMRPSFRDVRAKFKGGKTFDFKQLTFERELLPLDDNDSQSSPKAYKNGVFDSEFYVRDGRHHVRKSRKEDEYPTPPDSITYDNGEEYPGDEKSITAPANPRCIRSTSIIVM